MQPYIAPAHKVKAFHCPHCGAHAQQRWIDVWTGDSHWGGTIRNARCTHCGKFSMWVSAVLVYPTGGQAPSANPDLPEDIMRDYEEAREIVGRSPRGAAALLRLAIQKLCMHLGQSGKDINQDIGALVKAGLSPQIQRALDAVRVIGNESVHPGTLDLRDDPETALALFDLVNMITQSMISEPKQVDEIYAKLPPNKLKGIADRDGTTSLQ